MAANLKPLHDRVIVERIEKEGTVRNGIVIPDSATASQVHVCCKENGTLYNVECR